MNSCNIHAKISFRGEEVDSKLYPELIKLTGNRSLSQKLLGIAVFDPEFKKNYPQFSENGKLDNIVRYRDTGEPTLGAFISLDEIKEELDKVNIKEAEVINYLNKTYKCTDSYGEYQSYSAKDFRQLLDDAYKFNNYSSYKDDYAMIISKSNNQYIISVKSKRPSALNTFTNEDKESIESFNTLHDQVYPLLSNPSFDLLNGLGQSKTNYWRNKLFVNLLNNKEESEESVGDRYINAVLRTLGNVVAENKKTMAVPKEMVGLFEEFLDYIKNPRAYPQLYNELTKIIDQLNPQQSLPKRKGVYPLPRTIKSKDIEQVANMWIDYLNRDIATRNNAGSQEYKKYEIAFEHFTEQLQHDISLSGGIENFVNDLANRYKNKSNKDSSSEDDFLSDFDFSEIYSQSPKLQELLDRLVAIETKRKNINKQRHIVDKVSTEQDILEAIESEDPESGILIFLNSGIQRLQKMDATVRISNDKAKALRTIKDTIYSYITALDEIREVYNELPNSASKPTVMNLLDQVQSLCGNLEYLYKRECAEMAEKVFRDILPTGIKFETSVGKRRVAQSIGEMVRTAPKDITIIDRFIDSLADSGDYYLKAYHKFVSNQKEEIRKQILRVEDEINEAVLEYESEENSKDYSWFYAEKEDGSIDKSKYIQEINYDKFNNAKRRYIESLKKSGIVNSGKTIDKYRQKMRDFYNANMEVVEGKIYRPKKSLYASEKFARLTPAQRKFYDKMMSIYETHIEMLPPDIQHTYDSIKILNSNWERIRHAGTFKGLGESIKDKFKEDWTKYSDDIEYGEVSTLQDFQGRIVQKVPIYYVSLRNKNDVDRITLDVPSAMLSFCAMAREYYGMSSIVDQCEILTDQAAFREIEQVRAGKTLVSKVKIKGKEIFESKLYKKGEGTNSVQKLRAFNDMVLYGIKQKDEGNIVGKIDAAKAANNINKFTAMTTYAVNGLSSITNLLTGTLSARIEAVAGEHFKNKDLRRADAYYMKHIINYTGNIGKRVKTDILSALDREFDILQEYDRDIKDKDYISKTRLKQILGPRLAYIGNDIGEHFMQMRTFLAVASDYKVRSDSGTESSLLDAFETVPVNKNNPDFGVRIQIKKGYKNLDGSDISRTQLDKLARKSRALNNMFHGIYNDIDKSVIQQLAVGRMAVMFRKYLKPALNRRFRKRAYNFDVEGYQEGYYVTARDFMLELFSELKQGNFAVQAVWDSMTDYEKGNIKKAATEVGYLLAMMIALNLIDWDDDDDSYLKNLLEVTLRRWYTETIALVPSVGFISANLKLTTQPAAGVNWLNNVADMCSTVIHPIDNFSEDAVLQSGAYKGYKRGIKTILKTLPYVNPIVRTVNPETTKQYYK